MGPDAETVSKRSGPCVTPECEGVEWVMTTVPVGYQAWIGGVEGWVGDTLEDGNPRGQDLDIHIVRLGKGLTPILHPGRLT